MENILDRVVNLENASTSPLTPQSANSPPSSSYSETEKKRIPPELSVWNSKLHNSNS